MKKTLIALAVLGAAGVAQAQSSVTIYGQLNPSYDYVRAKANGQSSSLTNMADNSSRLGFKGSEDLGNGLKAIFQLEAYYNMVEKNGFTGGDVAGTFSDNAGARDSWVGLAGNFGSITFGAHDNVVKKMFASYDPFADSIADYNNIFTNGIKSRNARSAYYISPSFSGLTLNAAYALGSQPHVGGDQTDKYGIGLDYTNGPLQLTAAYGKDAGTTGDWKDYRLGAAYTLPTKTKLNAVWGHETKGAAAGGSYNTYLVGVQHPINNIDLIANYIWASDKDANDTGAKNFNLGARYNFSKRTNLTAMYSYLKNDANGTYSYDTGYGVDALGAKYNAFSVRLQHKF